MTGHIARALALAVLIVAPAGLEAVTGPAPAVAADANPQAVDLKAVERAFAATRTLQADFRQTAADGRVATGVMSLKRPGKVRFDYGKSASQLVVADGTRLSFVDYKVAQVSEWPIRATPLGVLLDPAADLSRVARILPAAQSPVPGQIAVAAQDPAHPDYGRIIFLLKPDAAAPGGLLLTGWRVLDAQGNLTVVELSDSRFNQPVSDSLFRFRDPRRGGTAPVGRAG